MGDIWDESDEIEDDFICIGENTYLVSGDLALHDFLGYLDLDDRDFESEYTTVGGWAIENLDGFPNTNDSFRYKNLTVTVTHVDGLRVERVSVFVEPHADGEEEE